MMATASERAPLEVGRIGFRKMLTLFLLYTIRPCIPRGSYQKNELFSMLFEIIAIRVSTNKKIRLLLEQMRVGEKKPFKIVK